MTTLNFSAEILIRGVNPYILVDKAQSEELKESWRKPMPVIVRVNGQPTKPWHINMMPTGDGDFYLYLHGEVRKASGTKVGDSLRVEVSFDNEYVGGPESSPAWFVEALASNKIASDNWNLLPPSRQKEIVRTLKRLKSPEIQAKILTQAMFVLSGNEGQFIGRFWKNGS